MPVCKVFTLFGVYVFPYAEMVSNKIYISASPG